MRLRGGSQAGNVDVSAPGNVRHASERGSKSGGSGGRESLARARKLITKTTMKVTKRGEREVGREALCRRKEALNDVAGGETAFCAALSLISAAHPGGWLVSPYRRMKQKLNKSEEDVFLRRLGSVTSCFMG